MTVLEVASRDAGIIGVRVPGSEGLVPLLAHACPSCGLATLHVAAVGGFAVTPGAGAAPPREGAQGTPYRDGGPPTFSLVLVHGGENKIGVIKVLRDIFKWDLKVAKDVVERPMGILAQNVPAADAQRIQQALAAVGARVDLQG